MVDSDEETIVPYLQFQPDSSEKIENDISKKHSNLNQSQLNKTEKEEENMYKNLNFDNFTIS